MRPIPAAGYPRPPTIPAADIASARGRDARIERPAPSDWIPAIAGMTGQPVEAGA